MGQNMGQKIEAYVALMQILEKINIYVMPAQ